MIVGARMYTEVVFSRGSPTDGCGHVGGGACLPPEMNWPQTADGERLVHLFSVPAHWFWLDETSDRWVSVFIPYTAREVSHYRRLRAKDSHSDAVVLAYIRASAEREESGGRALERGRMERSVVQEADDDENLASKIDGIDAWLQSRIAIDGFKRRLSIYGGDLDQAVPSTPGILSDGMGYLFLPEKVTESGSCGGGRFFLQLG